MALHEEPFTVSFYESSEGKCPVRAFLDELEATDPNDHAAVVAGLARLRDRINHREPLSKPLEEGLFELRHVGKLNTRVLWFFRKGRRIIAVHAIRNKGRKIRPRDMDIARDRMKDWIRRNPDGKE